MKFRSWLLPLLVAVPLLWAGHEAASCIRFKKPGGSVPPGLREPSDPAPPETEAPPPPSDGEAPPPATTPTPAAPATTPTTAPPPADTPDTGSGGPRKEPAPDDSTWETWWELNRIEFFPPRWVAPAVSSEGPQSALPKPLAAEVVQAKIWPTLLACVKDKHTFVQEAALITMGRIAANDAQRAEAREVLVQHIRHKNHEVARAAALGLAYVADASSMQPMYAVAVDEKAPEDVRAFLALTMTCLKHPMAAQLLQNLADVKEGYFELVGSALMGLGYNGIERDAEIPGFLEAVFENPKARAEYRALAVESFGRIGRLEVGAKILRRALNDRETEVRRSAALALGVLDYLTAAEKEIAAIRAPYEAVIGFEISAADQARIAALAATIADQRRALEGEVRDTVKALAQAAEKDNDAFTRHMALISLGRIAGQTENATAIRLIEAELKRDKVGTREYCILALAIARAPGAHEAAVAAITGKNRADTTRSAGCVALGILMDPKSDALLKETVLGDPHPYVRGYAALALGMIGTPASAETILPMMKSSRTPVTRAYGALGLALLGTRQGTDYLTQVLTSGEVKDGFVASHMVYALGLSKDRRQIDELIAKAADEKEDMYIRSAILAAIGYVSSAEFYPQRHLQARGYNYMLNMDFVSTYFYKL
jgi:HEAT repeat protein